MQSGIIIFIVASIWADQGIQAANIRTTPQNITRISGAQVLFRIKATNLSSENATFTLLVNETTVATVQLINFTEVNQNVSNSYSLIVNASSPYVNMTLEYTANQSATITIVGDGTNASARLNVIGTCGQAPIGFTPACMTYLCNASTATVQGKLNQDRSPFTYQCYNVSYCDADAQWNSATFWCNKTPTGCQSSGRWGLQSNCSSVCGGCIIPQNCDFQSGRCLDNNGNFSSNCSLGYMGEKCIQVATQPCDTAGKWGQFCNKSCSTGCKYSTCNRTGQCLDLSGQVINDCRVGYKGDNCNRTGCQFEGAWGKNCTKTCGYGCPGRGMCDKENGMCVNDTGVIIQDVTCVQEYTGKRCQNPHCPKGCSPGICVAYNLCQCPLHYESGPTCRNIRLEGFLKGTLPTFAILTLIVVLLSVSSKWHIRRKLKKS